LGSRDVPPLPLCDRVGVVRNVEQLDSIAEELVEVRT
jgi:hypothetical protein